MIPISPNPPGICQWGSAMHWVAFRRADDNNLQHVVLVVDLGNEVFREILLPELPDYTSKFAGLLSVSVSAYGNSIALFQNGYFSLVKGCQTGDFYLWVMEEYGVASSWTKVLKIGEGLPRPIGFKRNGEVVLLSYDGQLVWWVPWSTESKEPTILSLYGVWLYCIFLVFPFLLYLIIVILVLDLCPHSTSPMYSGWSRTWGEEHFGNGSKVHKYGKSTTGESWDIVVDEETYYEAEPHYGWADVVGDSSQLLSIEPRERPPGVYPNLDFGSSPPPPSDDSPEDLPPSQ